MKSGEKLLPVHCMKYQMKKGKGKGTCLILQIIDPFTFTNLKLTRT